MSHVGHADLHAGRRRRRLSGADRRASIVAMATAVFSTAGYERATMAEVARRLKVSEPVIFQNFGSKAAVFAAVVDDATTKFTASMRDRAAAHPSIGDWLAEILGSHHLQHLHGRGSQGALFAEASAHAVDPKVREALRRAHRTVAAALTELLTRGQADGSIRSDIDPETTAWWLLSFLSSQAFRMATMPEWRKREPHLGHMTLQMLTTGPGRRPRRPVQ